MKAVEESQDQLSGLITLLEICYSPQCQTFTTKLYPLDGKIQ